MFDSVKSLRCRHDCLDASLNSERSNYFAVWRRSRHMTGDDFTSGKQYWVLDVGDSGVGSRSLRVIVTVPNPLSQCLSVKKPLGQVGYVTVEGDDPAEYQKVYHLLYEEERANRKGKQRDFFQLLKESGDSMALKGKLLRGMYEDLKKMCRKPDMELLQCPFFLENEITTCHIPLFEDLRCLHFSPNHPDIEPRSLLVGQHYWKVDVGNCWNWALGFCDDTWAMRNDMVLDSEGIFLLFCIKEDNQCSLFTSSPLSPQYAGRPLGHVGVFLDYERDVFPLLFLLLPSLTFALLCTLIMRDMSEPDHKCQEGLTQGIS
ncbi:hypothetical protein GH733_007276, partial [Mirounga leonina]